MNRDHLALELDKVLELLAAETTCADAAEAARNLAPSPYLAEAQVRLEETDAAYRLMAGFGSPSFGHLQNVTNALPRADEGAVLSGRELVQSAENLETPLSPLSFFIRSLNPFFKPLICIKPVLNEK